LVRRGVEGGRSGRYRRQVTTQVRRLVAGAIDSALGERGRDARWLSARSGIEVGALEDVLAGERDVTVIELADIARALGVPVARLAPCHPERRGPR